MKTVKGTNRQKTRTKSNNQRSYTEVQISHQQRPQITKKREKKWMILSMMSFLLKPIPKAHQLL